MAITLDHLGELERTHSCGELRASDAGREVVLMGWVAVRRDFGPLTFIDLRRPFFQKILRLRAGLVGEIHRYMDGQGFTEIETPILIKSTLEGPRDYVVPSRLHHGRFYALPQSPQLFKQLCMIAGLDRYYQIARCFRDEDLRAQRQPEFTQLDVELSFPSLEQIYALVEGLFARVFRDALGVELPVPFQRLTF